MFTQLPAHLLCLLVALHRNMASALSEKHFWCSICLDIFINPVSIPCGHNFCLRCIKRFWSTRSKSECPLCRETFKKRPELRVNVGLQDITEQFKRSLKDKPKYKAAPQKRRILRMPSETDDVSCDTCPGGKSAAVKSCLVCRASYCETHLTPHLTDQALTQHTLTDPGTFVSSHFCRNHDRLLEKFCLTDNTPVCMKCTERDHRHHNTVPIEKEGRRIKSQIKKTGTEFQHMIHMRMKKLEEIKASVETNKETALQASVEVIAMTIKAIETNQSLLIDEVEQTRAEQFLKELEQEINELQRRRSELHHLENSEDHLHLIQSFPSLSAPLSTRNWSDVQVQSVNYIRTMRTVFSKLVDLCHKLENKLYAEEVDKMNQYAVDVTLDPETAASWLILSTDGKKVSVSSQQRKLSDPNDPRSFDSCVAVLGRQSFTSGRHYWVVQVGDKTDWDLGVARESINRKGVITVRPDSGFWAICRRKGGSLSACAGPSIALNLRETPHKVGVFLDYEEGSVSFCDAEAKTQIYTFSGCAFTEPLYPYLNPCLQDNGKNGAPLVICPVAVQFAHEAVAF